MTALIDGPMATDMAACWVAVCADSAVPAGQGVAALVAGEQVAVFRTDDGAIYAIGNRDPFTGANVLSRGIVGSRGGIPVVASPMLKHAFNLQTGLSMDDATVSAGTYSARVVNGMIEIEEQR